MQVLNIIQGIITVLSAAAIGWAAKEIISQGKILFHITEICKMTRPSFEERLHLLEHSAKDQEVQMAILISDVKYIKDKLDSMCKNWETE